MDKISAENLKNILAQIVDEVARLKEYNLKHSGVDWQKEMQELIENYLT